MNIRYFALAIAIAFVGNVSAQSKKTDSKKGKDAEPVEETDNVVSNGSFEDCEIKTLKAFGQLNELALPWFSPNKTSADLFAQGVKGTKVLAGDNDYGNQDPAEGTCYAGIRAYSKDPKKTRTYLETKLTQKLEKNQLYCVRFSISLADASKFAVNNVGIFFSDRKIQNANDFALTFTPQILEKTNKALNTMDGWEIVCGTYIASGQEEYIVIGGFGEDGKMKVEKMKKPAGETATLNEAYYFIDNIEIIPVEAASQCICGKADKQEADLIYSRSTAKSIDMTPQQAIQASGFYFASLSDEIPSMFEADVTEIARLMQANPSIKIELVGHSETEEMMEGKISTRYKDLALKRAEKVKAALVAAGVSADRITVSAKDDTSPANTKTTPMAKAQNRRVEVFVR